ncbi:hypothetical protein niasHT_002878 [Heterodera trifolii]|uniref:SSD domain-containing protein n=1 Tax=Heterodera trifolii TaxID=157864 RepID=A0ABD2M5M5_9BILA
MHGQFSPAKAEHHLPAVVDEVQDVDGDDDGGQHAETIFVRVLNRLFHATGRAIASYPWLFILVSTVLTAFCTVKMPLTPMSNDIADFTPLGARARRELQAYEAFFSNKGDPIALYVLVYAKQNGGNMLGVRELEEVVRLLNIVSERFVMFNSETGRNETFNEFCDNFCTINEPVRHFHSGLLLERNFGNSSLDHIDLGYPITTVLGRQLHMDPHFFGVKVAVSDSNGTVRSISVNQLRTENGQSVFDAPNSQLPNNIREIALVGLQFRAERPRGISKAATTAWERNVRQFVRGEFKSDVVNALVLSETFLTDEVVRAGLTLLPFLLIGFSIMVVFSSCTMSISAFYVRQMGTQKILLAVVACSCPFMACGTALGGMFWLGFRFGSLLCVTPFLVLALGVDDAYLMLNAWQRLRISLEKKLEQEGKPVSVEQIVQRLMAQVMVDTGASITITTLTNVLAFAIGALTPTPEIQLFSIGNAAAIVVVYIYQWTVFGSAMAIFGRWEFRTHPAAIAETPSISTPSSPVSSIGTSSALEEDNDSGIVKGGTSSSLSSESGEGTTADSAPDAHGRRRSGRPRGICHAFRHTARTICSRLLYYYCRALTNTACAVVVMMLLTAYLYISIFGLLNIRAELRPEQLFLRSSDVIELLHLRNEYIMPFYAVCMVFVNKPGNFSDPVQRQRWHSLVSDFEGLPSSVGRFSTKFWLRDYEQFVEQDPEDAAPPLNDLAAFEGIPLTERKRNELAEFLQWPEFQFWNGFLRLEPSSNTTSFANSSELVLSRFFFTTASYGTELREWSKRELLLGQWRRVADSYPELEVSVYEDDAKFLDLIPTMIPQTIQSSACTLLCMFLVCLLFMTNPGALLVSNFAIFSTCIGVFGIQSLLGTLLDPIFMSAAIMSIGFSVDIPAHIAYHFYKTSVGEKAGTSLDVEQRLMDCLATIGFPVLEAGLSTLICTSSLFFVDLHMARVFARTMTLVVAIGLLHGLLVIPVMFSLCNTIWRRERQRPTVTGHAVIWPTTVLENGHSSATEELAATKHHRQSERRRRSMLLTRKGSIGVPPTILTVNQCDR